MRFDKVVESLKPNKQIQILLYLAQNAEDDNTFGRTYKQIQKDVGVSEPIIAKTFATLQAEGLMKKLENGRWELKFIDGFTDECDGHGIYVERTF